MKESAMAAADSVDRAEIEKFSRLAEDWWNPEGKFKPLHRLNPLRIGYIRDRAAAHFRRDATARRPLSGLRLADIGSGGGLIAEPLARLGAHVTGIDAAARNVAVAKAHAETMDLAIDYRLAAAEELAAAGETFDIVLALEIIEHVADRAAFLAALAALRQPDGLIFLSTINRTAKSYLLAVIGVEYVLRWLPRGTHDWRKFLRPSELADGLRPLGLAIRDLTGIGYDPWRDRFFATRDPAVNYITVIGR